MCDYIDSIDLDHYHVGISQSTNFLGLIFDNTLTWQLHIDKICTKLKTGYYILRSLKSCLLVDNLKIFTFHISTQLLRMTLSFAETQLVVMKCLNYKKGPLE